MSMYARPFLTGVFISACILLSVHAPTGAAELSCGYDGSLTPWEGAWTDPYANIRYRFYQKLEAIREGVVKCKVTEMEWQVTNGYSQPRLFLFTRRIVGKDLYGKEIESTEPIRCYGAANKAEQFCGQDKLSTFDREFLRVEVSGVSLTR